MVAAAGLRWFASLPLELAVGLVLLWVAKDAALYPLVRQAYEPGRPIGAASLVGEHAVARERLAPDGWVLVRGELWRAAVRDEATVVEPGDEVRVVGVRGAVLVVMLTSRDAG